MICAESLAMKKASKPAMGIPNLAMLTHGLYQAHKIVASALYSLRRECRRYEAKPVVPSPKKKKKEKTGFREDRMREHSKMARRIY